MRPRTQSGVTRPPAESKLRRPKKPVAARVQRRGRSLRYLVVSPEQLEDRTLLSGGTLVGVANQLDSALATLQTQLTKVLDTATSVPFLGPVLGDTDAAQFINTLRPKVQSALKGLDSIAGGPSNNDIQKAIFAALGNNTDPSLGNTGGLNLIVDQNGNGIGLDDVIVSRPAAFGASGFDVSVHLHEDATLVTSAVVFNTGLSGLPFKVDAATTGSVNVKLGFDYALSFHYDATQLAVAFDPNAQISGAIPHALEVSVNAALSQDFSATATIGFVQGTLRPLAGQANTFSGTFTMDGLTNLQSAVLTGQAHMNLGLSGGFSGLPDFPSIGTNFKLDWTIDSSNASADLPTVSFSGVNLDLGQFLSGLLGPIINDIKSILGPPVSDILKVITSPIPGISDLSELVGNGTVSLLDLATAVADKTGYGALAKLVGTLVGIADDIEGVAQNLTSRGGDVVIDLGNFNLFQQSQSLLRPGHAGDLDNVSQSDLTSLVPNSAAVLENLASIANDPNVPQPFKNALSAIQQVNGIDIAFHLPFLEDPAGAVFGLLLGHDATVASLTVNAHLDSSGSKVGDVSYFGAGVTFGGDVNADAKFTFGYDTYGLREVIHDLTHNTGNIATDITDGFYVSTDSYLKVRGSIGVMAGASYGLVGFSVGGALTTGNGGQDYVSIGFAAPDGGPKLRWADFAPSAIKTDGELDATLSVTFRVGLQTFAGFIGISHTFDIGSVTVLDLRPNRPPPPPTILASAPDTSGMVTLDIGAEAGARRVYDGSTRRAGTNDPGGELYEIQHVGVDPIGETILITAFGVTQTIHGVQKIFCDSTDQGNLAVNIHRGVTSVVDLSGGAGTANLTDEGSGMCTLHAGQLESTLIGGSGADQLYGGPKNDTLVGGTSGFDTIVGGGGDNSISVQAPTTAYIVEETVPAGTIRSKSSSMTAASPLGSRPAAITAACKSPY